MSKVHIFVNWALLFNLNGKAGCTTASTDFSYLKIPDYGIYNLPIYTCNRLSQIWPSNIRPSQIRISHIWLFYYQILIYTTFCYIWSFVCSSFKHIKLQHMAFLPFIRSVLFSLPTRSDTFLYHFQVKPMALKEIIEEIDEDGSGLLEFGEFCQLAAKFLVEEDEVWHKHKYSESSKKLDCFINEINYCVVSNCQAFWNSCYTIWLLKLIGSFEERTEGSLQNLRQRG